MSTTTPTDKELREKIQTQVDAYTVMKGGKPNAKTLGAYMAIDNIMSLLQQDRERVAREARIEGIKLVDEALLDDITGSYPVPVVRNLIKLLIWENTPPEQRLAALQQKEEKA